MRRKRGGKITAAFASLCFFDSKNKRAAYGAYISQQRYGLNFSGMAFSKRRISPSEGSLSSRITHSLVRYTTPTT